MSLRDPEYRSAIDLLRKHRGIAGLTQQGLAEILGKPQSYVSKFERYERRLDVAEYIQVANAVGLPADEGARVLGWQSDAR